VTFMCHGEPGNWNVDSRRASGGYVRCAVNKRAYQLERYDRDPIHRITKQLNNTARRRRETIERRRAALRD
jgi:hypothetical protein